ncbi:TRAP transporter small permease [Oceanicella actignis]|uniref:TRAP transporter small permease protein n=1 Tax=Oceanicella actignis TaxID=1189325 RepID=A0A1M7SUU6_9RHOB|nr:TRAP transporter small permease [Oceanicella actignis]SES71712.1 C4-dicarboxylate transporter, DctQ subunit [Oceanicella actignis]SHN62242.1 C4-dicarboxylate transporter, DctQ subunit [Oceanicella actignis]
MAGKSPRSWTDSIEETLIAVILGAMTLLTFANVAARYMGSNILWALEATSFLFAWLVLLGASYAVKKRAHLGVDVAVDMLPPGPRRILGLAAAAACIVYAALLLKGGWDYWANFANLPATEGRWFPLGLEERVREKGWYEVNDIDMPAFLNPFFANWFNEGEPYEKIPRLIPYFAMPLSMTLLLLRFVQAALAIARGAQDRLIASHEAEDMIDAARPARPAAED